MYKQVTIMILAFSLIGTIAAQGTPGNTYKAVVQFNSVCCGVPSDVPVRKFIKSYKKTHNIKTISALRIGPMGREGEYWLAFSLKELSAKQTTSFINQLKKVVTTLKDPGNAALIEKFEIDQDALPGRATQDTIHF